jgi:hypothetical protein
MLNLTFNHVHHYNSGKSGFRHKIDLNTNELEEAIDFIAEDILDIELEDNNSLGEEILIENFELSISSISLSAPQAFYSSCIEHNSYYKANALLPEYERNVPPPRA